MGTSFRQEFWGEKKKAPIRRSGPLLKVYHGRWMDGEAKRLGNGMPGAPTFKAIL
jgi:hypothetical protein